MGCWANKQCFKRIESISNIFGEHNLKNASASIAAAKLIGISEFDSIKALEKFSGVKRRLELVENKKFILYDDFAHHPTAISSSIEAVKSMHPSKKISVIFEIRSNSMVAGAHEKTFLESFDNADELYIYSKKEVSWLKKYSDIKIYDNSKNIVNKLNENIDNVDIVIVMSNGDTSDILKLLN